MNTQPEAPIFIPTTAAENTRADRIEPGTIVPIAVDVSDMYQLRPLHEVTVFSDDQITQRRDRSRALELQRDRDAVAAMGSIGLFAKY